MRKRLFLIFLFTCACVVSQAQVNYVKNPDFEEYNFCPSDYDDIHAAVYWNAIDTVYAHYDCRPDYCHECATAVVNVPNGSYFYQYARSGKGMVQVQMYTDEMPPPSPPYYLYRDYLQGNLHKALQNGKSYCVKFYVNLEELSGYSINHIGAYLDDGSIDTVSTCSLPLTFVTPQVFSTSVISDTFGWTKIEGTFKATGIEKFITIGNFFDKSHTTAISRMPISGVQWAWYLVDDVSVIETDLPADAGPDVSVNIGDSIWIGRGLDSTKGLECRWYKNGILLPDDSVAGLWAKGITKGIDTYTVIQTICGTVKTDTALVYTFPVGMQELPGIVSQSYSIFPNPVTNGQLHLTQFVADNHPVTLTITDINGRELLHKQLQFNNKALTLELPAINPGIYLLHIIGQNGQRYVSRFSIQ